MGDDVGQPGEFGDGLVPVDRIRIAGYTRVVDQIAAGQPGVVHSQLVADFEAIEGQRCRRASRVVGDPDVAVGAHGLLVGALADAHDVHVVHHHSLYGCLDGRVDVIGRDTHDGGVQCVHPLASGIGEGVGYGDEVSAGDPAHRCQFDVDMKFVALDDRAVLFEDFLGLYVGVVTDDHLFEHPPVAGHARG